MFNGVLFGGKSKRIISHGMQDVESFQSLEAAVDVAGDVSEGMSHMQTGSAGIGKHIEHIAFRPAGVVGHLIGTQVFPTFLPFSLDIPELVFHK